MLKGKSKVMLKREKWKGKGKEGEAVIRLTAAAASRHYLCSLYISFFLFFHFTVFFPLVAISILDGIRRQ